MIVIGAGIVALLIYAARGNTDRPMMKQTEMPLAHNTDLDRCTEQEFFRPYHATENQQLGFTPHRYPSTTGGNISTLIHFGMSQLRLPAPQDNMWITRPPAEVMW